MSQLLIQTYLSDLDRLKTTSGADTEQVIRPAFRRLLEHWARSRDLIFVEELEYATPFKTKVYPDGTVLHALRVPHGYWEAKDTADNLDDEIRAKTARGYPQDNIIYENSEWAVLIQDRREVTRCRMENAPSLEGLINRFFEWERPEIAEFRKAVQQFQTDLPAVLAALRAKIDDAYSKNKTFQAAAVGFLEQAKKTINPMIGEADVREMLIQHILTEEIFSHVFNEGDFHHENNVAKALYALEAKFFTGGVKRDTLRALEPYYAAIRANAAKITAHTEKQTFLKVIYERFYKVYNPKAADRLGVVYTPNEIVRFIIQGADWLCQQHFGKALIDRNVEILDPATGTGTFICELLEHFRGQPQSLDHKYRNELHANEVAILPYYVANLNIEATYAAIKGAFVEFPHLCFVDTLDNTAGLGIRAGYQHEFFGAMSEENIERIRRQNARKISVVIGNPPYNVGQLNELNNNKNREYPTIDKYIRATYVAQSAAQKTALYDMYTRFFRWATDRLHENGVLAFITNRSFIDKRAFDGFRKTVAKEFQDIYVVDLGGDVRDNPKLSGTTHNVFGIQTGVAISFFVKNASSKKACNIHYARRPELETAIDKLAFLGSTDPSAILYQPIRPDEDGTWLNKTSNDWQDLMPVADKDTKRAKKPSQQRAIFSQFSTGIMSGRDEWVYDNSPSALKVKMAYFKKEFEKAVATGKPNEKSIKWSRNLKRKLGPASTKRDTLFDEVLFRPFVTKNIWLSKLFVDELGAMMSSFRGRNKIITFLSVSSANQVAVLASTMPVDYGLLKAGNGGTQCLFRYRYTEDGERADNITDWALNRFHKAYGKSGNLRPNRTAASKDSPAAKIPPRNISKDDIFNYVYAVLHDPVYKVEYAANLRRTFPRIPFKEDFWRWADWGAELIALHLGFASAKTWPVRRSNQAPKPSLKRAVGPKAVLRSEPSAGKILIDSETTLENIPPAAWEYKLGNRPALDWILDQFKEKKPRDPVIVQQKLNTYRFADHKEHVIDLLGRVTRLSVATAAIQEEMAKAGTGP